MKWGWYTPFKCPYLVYFDSKKGSTTLVENKLQFTDLGKKKKEIKNGEGTVRVFTKERG